jgi:hypothetical protein
VAVAEVVELLEPPAVGGPVADLRPARECGPPRDELGGALDEDQPWVVLLGVVEHAVGGGAVAFGPRDPGVEVRVLEVEQRQSLLVGLLGVGLRVVHAADPGDEQVACGQVARGVVVGRLGVDQVGDPVLGGRMVGLVDLDLVAVVVRGHDRREAGAFDALSEASEAGEQVDGDQVVVSETAAANGGSVLRGSGHRFSPGVWAAALSGVWRPLASKSRLHDYSDIDKRRLPLSRALPTSFGCLPAASTPIQMAEWYRCRLVAQSLPR